MIPMNSPCFFMFFESQRQSKLTTMNWPDHSTRRASNAECETTASHIYRFETEERETSTWNLDPMGLTIMAELIHKWRRRDETLQSQDGKVELWKRK